MAFDIFKNKQKWGRASQTKSRPRPRLQRPCKRGIKRNFSKERLGFEFSDFQNFKFNIKLNQKQKFLLLKKF